jgi:hypothetical protein
MPRLAQEVKAYSRGKSKNPKHETALRGEKKKKKQKETRRELKIHREAIRRGLKVTPRSNVPQH